MVTGNKVTPRVFKFNMRDFELKLAIIKITPPPPLLSTSHAIDAGSLHINRDMGKRLNRPSYTATDLSAPQPLLATVVGTAVEVHPITIRKTPKFPSRDRHLAIRRKKGMASNAAAGTRANEETNLNDGDCGDFQKRTDLNSKM